MTMQATRLPRLGAALLALALAGAAMAQQGAAAQAPARKPQTHNSQPAAQPAPRYGKVGDSIQRGTDAAGRGVAKADDATRRGIAKGSEAASRPVRNAGDSLGRALGLGPARTGGPAKGPQSEGP